MHRTSRHRDGSSYNIITGQTFTDRVAGSGRFDTSTELCGADGSGDLRRVLSSSPYQAPASQYITRSISRSRGTPLGSLGTTLSAAAGLDRDLSRGQPRPQASSLGPASPAARRSASTGRGPHASTERAASRGRGPLAQGDRLGSQTQAAFAEQLAARAARDASRGRARSSVAPAGGGVGAGDGGEEQLRRLRVAVSSKQSDYLDRLSSLSLTADSPMSASGHQLAPKALRTDSSVSSQQQRRSQAAIQNHIRRLSSSGAERPLPAASDCSGSQAWTAQAPVTQAALRRDSSGNSTNSFFDKPHCGNYVNKDLWVRSKAERSSSQLSSPAQVGAAAAQPPASYADQLEQELRQRKAELAATRQAQADAVGADQRSRGRSGSAARPARLRAESSSSSSSDGVEEESKTSGSGFGSSTRSSPAKRDSQGRLIGVDTLIQARHAVTSPVGERSRAWGIIVPTLHSEKSLIRAALDKSGLVAAAGQGCVGLCNLGNTCFANSILQCLNAIPELAAYFLEGVLEGRGSRARLAAAYSDLVRQMWSGREGTVVQARKFLLAAGDHDSRWGDGRQHDAQEFLHSILEQMQTELNRVTTKTPYKELSGKGTVAQQAEEAWTYALSRYSSVVDETFAGQLQSTITCSACRAESHCFDLFLDLSVPLPQPRGLRRSYGHAVSIEECLGAFTELETLAAEDGYNCTACRRQGVRATKRLTLYRLPPVLMIHLKRFSANSGSGLLGRFSALSKDTTPVSLQTAGLDLSEYCSEVARRGRPVYDLVAVSSHSGGLGGGHYTAQCKSLMDGQWRDYNDASVTKINPFTVSSDEPYVLFWRRQ